MNLNVTKDKRKKVNTLDENQLYFGKIAPNAKELEVALLGTIIMDKNVFDVVIETIKPECFYAEAHQRIFMAMYEIQQKNCVIDILGLAQELRFREELELIGGPYYLTTLTNNTVSLSNAERYAKIIYEKYIQREVIRISGQAISHAYEDSCDAFDLVDQTEKEISSINNISSKSYSKIENAVVPVLINIENLRHTQDTLTGIDTGYIELNKLTCGWQSPDFIVLAARPSVGKCLSFDTKILMYDGSIKKVQDISVNDLLMGKDSRPRKVLSICTGTEKMFHVKQLYGIDYRVNESHILSLKRSKNEGNKKHGEILNISVKDYNKKGPGFKARWKGYKVPVDFKEKEVPIPPYLLGIWLGDGTSSSTEITKPDSEIEEYLQLYADSNGFNLSISNNNKRCKSYSLIGKDRKICTKRFLHYLRELNVLNNKHIPNDYLINSRENRLQLLAGLIDTDGYNSRNSGYEISQKNEKLFYQIKFLADTLGFRVCIFKDKIIKGVIYKRMFISGNIYDIPCLIKRKKIHPQKFKRDCTMSGIKVIFDKVDTYYGFELSGDGLFLLEDCTVTHNTALALKFAMNAAKSGKGVGFFSLEMNQRQLIQRIISAESGIRLENILRGRLSEDEMLMINKTASDFSRYNLMIDDKAAPTIYELRNKARKMYRDGARLIIIDYLQLMSGIQNGRSDNREQEISKISRDIKGLAKELDIPIIALSQLSRDVEKRSGVKMPMLSDLRESGAIEQDADIVMFMYRPEYYSINVNENGDSMNGETHIKFGKHRNGTLDTIKLRASLSTQQFYDFVDQPKQLGLNGNFRPVTKAEKVNFSNDDIEDNPF